MHSGSASVVGTSQLQPAAESKFSQFRQEGVGSFWPNTIQVFASAPGCKARTCPDSGSKPNGVLHPRHKLLRKNTGRPHWQRYDRRPVASSDRQASASRLEIASKILIIVPANYR